MARPRTAMRKIREVLRLSWDVGLSPRQVQTSLGVSRITVRRYLERVLALIENDQLGSAKLTTLVCAD